MKEEGNEYNNLWWEIVKDKLETCVLSALFAVYFLRKDYKLVTSQRESEWEKEEALERRRRSTDGLSICIHVICRYFIIICYRQWWNIFISLYVLFIMTPFLPTHKHTNTHTDFPHCRRSTKHLNGWKGGGWQQKDEFLFRHTCRVSFKSQLDRYDIPHSQMSISLFLL